MKRDAPAARASLLSPGCKGVPERGKELFLFGANLQKKEREREKKCRRRRRREKEREGGEMVVEEKETGREESREGERERRRSDPLQLLGLPSPGLARHSRACSATGEWPQKAVPRRSLGHGSSPLLSGGSYKTPGTSRRGSEVAKLAMGDPVLGWALETWALVLLLLALLTIIAAAPPAAPAPAVDPANAKTANVLHAKKKPAVPPAPPSCDNCSKGCVCKDPSLNKCSCCP